MCACVLLNLLRGLIKKENIRELHNYMYMLKLCISTHGHDTGLLNKNTYSKLFSYFSTKGYVVGTPKSCLSETVLLKTFKKHVVKS